MDARERRATALLALLAALAVTVALVATPSGRATQSAAQRDSVAAPQRDREARRAPSGFGPAREPERIRSGPRREGRSTPKGPPARASTLDAPGGPCVDAGLPVYPGSTSGPNASVSRELRAAIQALPRMPDLEVTQRLLIPFSAWSSGNSHGRDPFSFFGRHMHAVNFWDMPQSLRTMLGLRPRGTVDSDPLLYRSRSGAVLLRPLESAGLIAVMLCPDVSTA